MKTLLISFTLNNSDRDYNSISETIRSYPKWARLLSNTWIIRTNDKIVDVRSRLSSTINEDGRILVIDVTNSGWATYAIDSDITHWMKENI